MSIRILLVDDHQMFREGLRAILERSAEMTVVGQASDGREALKLAGGAEAPDIVVMDIGMSGLNGVDATRQILAANPKIKIIALSAHSDRRFIAAMLDAGASAYLLKESAGAEMLRAVHAVYRGQKYLCPSVAAAVIEGYVHGDVVAGISRSTSPLSPREREIVQLLAEGKTSKEIAKVLHIAGGTVETHRRNIMGKLKVTSMAALTKLAIREGLTSVER